MQNIKYVINNSQYFKDTNKVLLEAIKKDLGIRLSNIHLTRCNFHIDYYNNMFIFESKIATILENNMEDFYNSIVAFYELEKLFN